MAERIVLGVLDAAGSDLRQRGSCIRVADGDGVCRRIQTSVESFPEAWSVHGLRDTGRRERIESTSRRRPALNMSGGEWWRGVERVGGKETRAGGKRAS